MNRKRDSDHFSDAGSGDHRAGSEEASSTERKQSLKVLQFRRSPEQNPDPAIELMQLAGGQVTVHKDHNPAIELMQMAGGELVDRKAEDALCPSCPFKGSEPGGHHSFASNPHGPRHRSR